MASKRLNYIHLCVDKYFINRSEMSNAKVRKGAKRNYFGESKVYVLFITEILF